MAIDAIKRLWLGAAAVLLTIVSAILGSANRSTGVRAALAPGTTLRIAFWTRCVSGLLLVFAVVDSFRHSYPGLRWLHEDTLGATGRLIFALLALRFFLDCRSDLKVLSAQPAD